MCFLLRKAQQLLDACIAESSGNVERRVELRRALECMTKAEDAIYCVVTASGYLAQAQWDSRMGRRVQRPPREEP